LRGTIRKDTKKDGSVTWSYLVFKGTDEDCKKKYIRKRGFATEGECEAALAEVITNINKGIIVADGKMTVNTYLDKWMKTYAKTNVKHTTYKRYETFVKQIKEYLGVYKLSKLNPLIIQEFYTDLQNDRKISNNTLIKTHRMLHAALKQAQKWQLIHVNPTDLVTLPKGDPIEMNFWDPEDIKDYLDLIKNEPLYPVVYLAVHTGMREAELSGLRWEDVDLINKTITVKNSVQRENGLLVLDSLKTKKSFRVITLLDSTIPFLKELKKKDKEKKLKFKLDPNFVFHWDEVTTLKDNKLKKDIKCYRPIDPHYIAEEWPEILGRIKNDEGELLIPKIRFHDLRHTHATLLRKLGVDVKVISERLGHSDVAFTLKTYTHVNTEMQRDEVSKVGNYL
jgi:integrase